MHSAGATTDGLRLRTSRQLSILGNSPLSTLPHMANLLPPQVPDEQCSSDDILVLSACFRAGRAGASTDHSCVMFDVDLPTCTLKKGTSNAHWYESPR